MKKRPIYITLCALAIILSVSLSSCSLFMTNPISPDVMPSKPSGEGPEWIYPDGDDGSEEPADPIDPNTCVHQFSEWNIIQEMGCFGIEGVKERTCALCGSRERVTESVDGHGGVVKDAAVEATCTATGLTEGSHCELCGEVFLAQSVIPMKSHTYDGAEDDTCNVCGFFRDINCEHTNTALIEAREPTCIEAGHSAGDRCEDCGEFLTEPEMIDALGHKEATLVGYAPTETEWGLTDGKICTVCDTVTIPQRPIMPIGYENIHLYASSYAFEALEALEKGKAMQELYLLIDDAATLFHTDTSIDADMKDGAYVVGNFDFASLGLNSNDAIIVWSSYKIDHPLYYWIDSSFTYSDERINLLSGEDYAKGEQREKYNKLVFDSAREYLSLVENEGSPYRIALALHDAIIKSTAYAYKEDGVTPREELWAHNVLGVFEKKSGVCESYAKTFQMLLNYCGIENILVSGESFGEDHAWNMVRMEDGEWYWFDLTWDDTPGWMNGVSYNYFCVTDDRDISWMDGPWVSAEKTFASTHTHSEPDGIGIDYLYALPDRAKQPCELEIDMLRDTFEVDGLKYALTGFGEVYLVGVLRGGVVEIPETGGVVEIPETVEHGGYEYSVVGIGGMTDRLIKPVPIETDVEEMPNIVIPCSVTMIWDKALMLFELDHIKVAEDNPVYTSLDGILFTKDLYTLVQYPLGSDRTEYTVPDETAEIANYSFGDGTEGALRSVTLGKGVSLFGTLNAGYGHRSKEGGRLNIADGDIFYIRGLMGFDGEIVISPENNSFIVTDYAVYSADGKVLHFVTNKNITLFECPESIEIIDVGAFFGCERLGTLTLSKKTAEIRSFALGYCSSMQKLIFPGNESDWAGVEKKTNWKAYASNFEIAFS